MIDTIIFDAEGVVIDTESLWDQGQRIFLKRRGIDYDRARIKHLLTGRSVAEGAVVIQREYGFPGDPDLLARERIEIAKELFRHEVKFIEGFEEFFNAIRSSYKTCIATVMPLELLEIVDRRLGLSKLFRHSIFTANHIGNRSKPHPDIFLFAAARLGSNPPNCLVIEDAPYGIEAAKRAGMKCIGLATTYEPDKLQGADRIVSHYSEIDLASL
ncbi:MAG TPA: HAD family phosphatase [Syntrophobacteraceae bacterium]|nr:HAD family phosphatase [Syntrophobacteraceae bacterium]